MNSRPVLAFAAGAASAVAVLFIASAVVTRAVLQPAPVPPGLADDVALRRSQGWRHTGFCPRRCPYRNTGRPHVHMRSPGGDIVTLGEGQLEVQVMDMKAPGNGHREPVAEDEWLT